MSINKLNSFNRVRERFHFNIQANMFVDFRGRIFLAISLVFAFLLFSIVNMLYPTLDLDIFLIIVGIMGLVVNSLLFYKMKIVEKIEEEKGRALIDSAEKKFG